MDAIVNSLVDIAVIGLLALLGWGMVLCLTHATGERSNKKAARGWTSGDNVALS
jgi:hypothetical protein